jgi:hypothetical protein
LAHCFFQRDAAFVEAPCGLTAWFAASIRTIRKVSLADSKVKEAKTETRDSFELSGKICEEGYRSEKFTVIWVSNSAGSPFKRCG